MNKLFSIFLRTISVLVLLMVFFMGWNAQEVFAGDSGNISAGSYHTCAITADNNIRCWGDNLYGKATPPSGTFKQVSSGINHTCGITTDDHVKCWGDPTSGKTVEPNETFKQISAGGNHTCGIMMDDHIKCWGDNSYGKATPPNGTFKQVSNGTQHSCGITTDDHIVCWGDNSRGQSNYPPSGEKYKQVSASLYYTCGLRIDSTVNCWGANNDPILKTAYGFYTQIGAGSMHACGIRAGGIENGSNIFCGGYPQQGNTTVLPGTYTEISLGVYHSCGIKTDGAVTCWGGNSLNQRRSPEGTIFKINALASSTTTNSPISNSGSTLGNDTGSPVGGNGEPIVNSQDEVDPVNLSRGEMTYTNTLMSIPGQGIPYTFELSYKSQTYYNGPLGINFDHNYNRILKESSNGEIEYYNGTLNKINFKKKSDGTFAYQENLKANLIKNGNVFIIEYIDGKKEYFGTNLRISRIVDIHGNTLQFQYNDRGQLLTVIDTLGREISYLYNQDDRIIQITDFFGKFIKFHYIGENEEYGSNGDLGSITLGGSDGGEKTISFAYSKNTESPQLAHNLLHLIDSKNQVYVENEYDENDRVTSQRYGNGTVYYTYTLDNEGKKILKNKVKNRNGGETEYSYDASGNTIKREIFTTSGTTVFTFEYDDLGNLKTETKPLGNGTSNLYDTQNRIIEKRQKADMSQPDDNINDLVTTFEYQTNFQTPTKITDPTGDIVTTTLDAKGNLIETKILGVKKANGLTYDVTNTFAYDTTGHLITKTDKVNCEAREGTLGCGAGNQTNYEYENGKLTKVTEGVGDETTTTLFTYDTHGNLLSTTDSEGNTKQFTYDQYDRLISSLSPEGIMSEIAYDVNNNKTEQKVNLENGKVLKSTSVYDILDQVTGNIIGSSTDDQRTTSMVRDANGNIIETTDVQGLKTKYIYDIFDRPIEKRILKNPTDPNQDIVTKYTYDQNGNIIQSIDARNTSTAYQYDHFDRMTTSTDVLGTKNILTYDKQGNITILETRDGSGKTLSKTERVFDSLGNVIRETQGAIDGNSGITTTVDYNANGKPVKVTDAKGNITTVTYDSLSRKKTVTDGLGNQTILTYDKRGLVTKQEVKSPHPSPLPEGEGISTTFTYNKDGRLTSKTDSLGNKTSSLYNKLGQVTQVTDANGNKTNYVYDVFGNVLSETKALTPTLSQGAREAKTSYEYDKSNNRTKLTDANGNITTYEYDSVNRLTKETLADGSFTTYEYDAVNNIIKKIDANGTQVTNTYDQLNRLTKRSITRAANILGVTEENYVYDALGRLTSSTDSEGNILSFTYDSLNRLTKEIQNGKVIETGYDANGNQTSLTYPSGKKAEKTYDSLNRLTTISLDGKSTAIYSYDSLTLNTLTLTNGAKTTYSYDPLLRLQELTNISNQSIVNKLSFGYDKVNNILTNGENNYSYDAINRLTSVDKHDNLVRNLDDKKQEKLSIDYNYDNLGNRDSVEQTLNFITKKGKEKEKIRIADYTSNSLNQYTQVSSGKKDNDDDDRKAGNNGKFTYDRNGNLTDDGKQKYFYDYRNRLVKVLDKKDDTARADFKYDILGRRNTKTTYNDDDEVKKIIRYTYSNQDTIEETTSGIRDGKERLKDTKEYVYGKGMDDVLVMIQTTPDGKKQTEKRYFYQKNQLGSITAITDDKGKLVEKYKYDEFGKAYTRKEKKDEWKVLKKSDIGNMRLFTGREYDKEVGLYYFRARYYSADLGRFISRDPIGTRDNVNLYSYVSNNPLRYTDPMGLEKALFIKNNEGNAWFFESADILTGNSGHAAFYFINNGQEYLINYNPLGSTGVNPSGDGDMFLGTVNGTNEGVSNINDYRDVIINESDDLYSTTKIGSNYINTSKLSEWYRANYETIPSYNTFTNNCSDQVEDALEYAGFFQFTEIYGIPTMLPGNMMLPGTTPGGLGYDINLELFYKNLVY